MVGRHHDVLDIGCGEGDFAAELQKNGNRVAGIDVLSEPANRPAFDRYFSADLENGISTVVRELGGRRFDRVLALDVLHHLRSPERLLQECRELLDADGQLIVSLPNFANVTVRLALLAGRFEYAERGILDRAHLRFFTRKTARRLLRENGYQILQERSTIMPVELVLNLSPTGLPMKVINRLLAGLTRLMPGLLGYQIVMLARKS
jgi:2-polyprenyl-3-methyl-5-hydroxy-6-metoxy-1,4-benzoquinol methylase